MCCLIISCGRFSCKGIHGEKWRSRKKCGKLQKISKKSNNYGNIITMHAQKKLIVVTTIRIIRMGQILPLVIQTPLKDKFFICGFVSYLCLRIKGNRKDLAERKRSTWFGSLFQLYLIKNLLFTIPPWTQLQRFPFFVFYTRGSTRAHKKILGDVLDRRPRAAQRRKTT